MIYIMAFSGQVAGQRSEDIIARHMPLWLAHRQNLIFVSPEDARYESPFQNVFVGKRGYGPGAGEQFKWILNDIAKNSPCGWGIIHEYDSFCLEPQLKPPPEGLWGNVNWIDDARFIAMRYATAPWVVTSRCAQMILEASVKWPDLGYWENDRLLCSWAALAGVPLLSFAESGFTRNTISVDDVRTIAWRKPFPKWIHGVKHAEVLTEIVNVWNQQTHKIV